MAKTTYEEASLDPTDHTDEEWRYIDGYDGLYEVSNKGRVRRTPTTIVEYTESGAIVGERTRDVYYLNPTLNFHGYYHLGLTCMGKTKTERVHDLVARTFLPHDESETVIHHIDGISTNNDVCNLVWLTPDEHKEMHRDKSRRTYLDKLT
jgi:hypothetical protein